MRDESRETVSESYSFVCFNCGRGWEQTYTIEHHLDEHGDPYVLYFTGRERVSSPLARLTCLNCGAHRIRVMRAGTVSAIEAARVSAVEPAVRRRRHEVHGGHRGQAEHPEHGGLDAHTSGHTRPLGHDLPEREKADLEDGQPTGRQPSAGEHPEPEGARATWWRAHARRH
ncbi:MULTISPECIES: hypothetical protein [Streptomyces]|uniref:hypothetical protein n=1 Tax=Streptomyces TaxID=1883 RepID=UPI001D131A1F|nr:MULTISPECIES: hypothetical protein [Streptomyces]